MESADHSTVKLQAAWLSGHTDGLIVLTGGERGPVGSLLIEHADIAEQRLLVLKAIFPDHLYVELQRHHDHNQAVENGLIELAYRHDLPLVATNDAYFATKDDFEAHDALLAIAAGTLMSEDDRRRLTPDYCLRSQKEMI